MLNCMVKRLQVLGAPAHHSTGSHSKLREIQDPLTWARCFLLFLAAQVDHRQTRDLAAYGVIVLDLARAHGGQGWLSYDCLFRQQKAAGEKCSWTEINSSTMVSTVLSSLGCDLCNSPGHTKSECALNTMDPYARPLPQGPQQDRSVPRIRLPRSGDRGDNLCRRYNKGNCFSQRCRYEHTCSACHKAGHPALDCQTYRKKPPVTPAGRPT